MTKNTRLGLRSLFVIIWFVLVVPLADSDLLNDLLGQSNAESGNLIVAVILLVPIAIVVFPAMYQIGDIYRTSEKKSSTPTWKRNMIGIAGTGMLLGIVLYLFTIITFALFYRF
jgi:heme/copper-type cytochrome/quinol oxidase subunit 2